MKENWGKKGTRLVPGADRGQQGEGLRRGTGLGRPLIKSFRLKVWAEGAVKSRQMLCPDVLPVLMGSVAGQEKAACSQHCASVSHSLFSY